MKPLLAEQALLLLSCISGDHSARACVDEAHFFAVVHDHEIESGHNGAGGYGKHQRILRENGDIIFAIKLILSI